MPFLGQICLTELGDFSTSDLVNVYSDVDGFNTPIDIYDVGVEPIPIFLMMAPNCPFILPGIPDGTTQIKITTTDGDVCTYLPVQSSNLCENCSFGLTQYSTQSIGRISVGVLTASCENFLTGYTIEWYNADGQVQFTSGAGSPYFDYEYQQPATGDFSIFVPPGTYYPVVRSISLSGLTFTSDESLYGTDQIVAALDCLPATEVLVEPYACEEGTDDCPPYATAYTHCLVFSGDASSTQTIPEVQPIWLQMTENTNYVAFSFNGVDFVDDIKIVYFGANYDNPFLLDWYKVGTNNAGSNLNNFPRTIDPIGNNSTNNYSNFTSRTFKKVICMTGFTNIDYDNDYFIFEVIPNQSNPNTDWYLNFTCLEDFDCESCFLSAETKIILSSVTLTTTTSGCGTKRGVTFTLTGCSVPELLSDDVLTYFNTSTLAMSPPPLNFGGGNSYPFGLTPQLTNSYNTQVFTPTLTFSGSCIDLPLTQTNTSCATPLTSTNTFVKTYNSGNLSSTILMTFDSFDLFNFYYQSYLVAEGAFDNNFTDPSLETYYETYTLFTRFHPFTPSTACGDSTPLKSYVIPKQAQVMTAQTDSQNYTIQITYTKQSNQLSSTSCFYTCVQGRISQVEQGLQQTINTSTTVGSRVVTPFASRGFDLDTTNTAVTKSNYWVTHKNLLETLPRNYNFTSQLFPQYSSVTCPNIYTTLTPTGTTSNQMYYKNYATHRVSLIDENNPGWFKIERLIPEPVTVLVYSGDPATFNNINTTYVLE
jgi:hypothetical protein